MLLENNAVASGRINLAGTVQGQVGSTLNGEVTLTSSAAEFTMLSGPGKFTINSRLSDGPASFPARLTTTSSGAVIELTNPGNDYNGATLVSGTGQVVLGASGVIPDGSNLAVDSGATLDLNGHNEIVNGLSGSGLITNGDSVSAILIVGAFSGDGTYSGNIQDGAGKVILSKVGSGTQTLSGNNTYTGATNVQAGRLIAASNAALGSTFSETFVTGTGALTVGSGVTTNEPLTVESGRAVLLENNAVVGGSINLAGTVQGQVGSTLNGEVTLTSSAAEFTMLSGPGKFTINSRLTDGPANFPARFTTTSSGRRH